MRMTLLGKMVLVGSLVIGFPLAFSQAWADETSQLKDQVTALQQRVDQLESQLADKQQAQTMAPAQGYAYIDTDPFTQMMLMQRQMERNMHQAFADTGVFNPRMDMKQTDQKYIITMDIPGMDKDKIDVQTKDGLLIISGERRSETDDNNNNQYYRQDRSFGTFMQQIPLPDDAKTDQIEAKYKNGVLKVTVGRMSKEEKKSKNSKIMVN